MGGNGIESGAGVSMLAAFTVTMDGVGIPSVIAVSGLKAEVDKIEVKQQTQDGKYVVRQLIGRPKGGELTITRGLAGSRSITDWLAAVMEGDDARARRSVAVALLDDKGETLKTYNFVNCWLKSIEVGSLKAGDSEQATEKLVVCYDESNIS